MPKGKFSIVKSWGNMREAQQVDDVDGEGHVGRRGAGAEGGQVGSEPWPTKQYLTTVRRDNTRVALADASPRWLLQRLPKKGSTLATSPVPWLRSQVP